MSGDGRDAVLARIRAALVDGPADVHVPRTYRTATPAGTDLAERFAERVADYHAIVRQVTRSEVSAVVAELLQAIPARLVVAPTDLPSDWLRDVAAEILTDTPSLSHAVLDGADAVVTGCVVAIATTGTIVLDAGPEQGRRALSLLPDHHVCIVRLDQIVGDVPQALPRLDPRRPLTWISGPSATSDIELQRIEGVHGPRHQYVVIVRP